MSIDPVFPLPEPDFLWVHTLTLQPNPPGDVVVDSAGKWVYGDATTTTVTGYLTAPNPREVERAAARDILLDAVALVPHGTTVDSTYTLTATDPRTAYYLLGTYAVSVVRPNPSHLRLLLTRIEGELPAHDPGNEAVNAQISAGTVGGGVGV